MTTGNGTTTADQAKQVAGRTMERAGDVVAESVCRRRLSPGRPRTTPASSSSRAVSTSRSRPGARQAGGRGFAHALRSARRTAVGATRGLAPLATTPGRAAGPARLADRLDEGPAAVLDDVAASPGATGRVPRRRRRLGFLVGRLARGARTRSGRRDGRPGPAANGRPSGSRRPPALAPVRDHRRPDRAGPPTAATTAVPGGLTP